ncbi:homoserine dehydrogenase [Enterococcus ureilyticus]|uniref:Homoserine dehydrogenase n=1 Tax=Enterococcus ureilyticus TaxID=1131292 RepID=A0A1E5HA38_9ENTE|nr:homoserine dehydrogenase [Enterococcus ureilyticus]MBM7688266.1 homoserine dehydrogenase [Enterococcus ureilyticus]MBO0447780.1 homoserine dehydrogenase [Enterococcus ureilyticus]OEG21794.1 homoserine dehydrogenase [Enterococcus ureilyticus]
MKEKLKIGLLGLGTVGSGVPTILQEHQEKISQVTGMEIIISKALVRDEAEKRRLAEKFDIQLTTNIEDIINDDEIKIIVELIGKVEPAKTFITKALENGKHIVTANKDLLAQHGSELVALAQKNHCDLYYEASVAGGIPILRTIANSLAADNIQKVLGIVNGTTNYMLTQMVSEKKSYDQALKEAQDLGFAESDPTNDVDGIDAAYKMVILSQFAFGMNIRLDQVDTRGIRGLSLDDVEMAAQLGYEVKLIGSSENQNGSIAVEVGPMLVAKSHPIASVRNEFNAVFIESSGVGESMYYGPGAGAKPTATSVVSDLITIAKNIRLGTTGHMFNAYQHDTKLAEDETISGKYYFSIEVPDRHGQILKLTQIMTEADVSFDQLVQQKSDGTRARIVAITHMITKHQMKQVTKKIESTDEFELLNTFKVLED